MPSKKYVIAIGNGAPIEVDTKVHQNTAQDYIVTTKDKVKLSLIKYLEKMDKSRQWAVPLGIFLTLLAAVLTASFHDALYLKGSDWELLFKVGVVSAGIWCLYTSKYLLKAPKVDDIIDDIMKDESKIHKNKTKDSWVKAVFTKENAQKVFKYLTETEKN